MDPPADEALGQVDIFVRSWVRLTFGEMYSHRQGHLMAKCDTTFGQVFWLDIPPTGEASGQVDIWSNFGSG